MWKQLGSELWTRIFLSYKSTIVGLLCAVGVVLVDWATNVLSQYHWALAPSLAVILAAVGAALKSKAQADLGSLPPPIAPVTPSPGSGSVPPKASAAVLGLLCVLLSMPGLVRADATDSPLVLSLGHNWTLRPNVTVGPLTGYRWTLGPGNPGAWVASVSVGGLYVFDWKETFCVGLGGSLDVGAATKSPTLEGDLMAGGPVLHLPSTTTGLRPAVALQYTSAGGAKQMGILGTLSLNF